MMVAPALCTGCSGSVFQNSRTFSSFSRHSHGVPELLQIILEGSGRLQMVLGGLDVPGCIRMQLEESGRLVGVSGQFQNIWS